MLIQDHKSSEGVEEETKSLCPVCKKIIKARIFEEDGRVMISKRCEEHGEFKDVYWGDVPLYLKAKKYAFDGVGIENPQSDKGDEIECPFACGLCKNHKSHTALAIIDLTNRCNQNCKICFARANVTGYVYEPSFEEVVGMMKVLRNNRPVPCPAIQFSGGEPTIYSGFIDVIREAKKMGFAQIQVATNGLKFVDRDFLQESINAGLNTAYLHFDGMDEKVYEGSGGRPIYEKKFKVIENCGLTTPHLPVVLVPTIINGENDDQIWPTLDFAFEHLDPILGVNFQPISFAGRIGNKEREKGRITIPDLIKRIEKDSNGVLSSKDFFPVPCVAPMSEVLSLVDENPKLALTVHPHCGMATYVFKNGDRIIPITDFVDVEGFLEKSKELAMEMETSKMKKAKLAVNLPSLLSYVDTKKAPLKMRELLLAVVLKRDKKSLAKLHWQALFIGAMHFQDLYNYDIERVKRCQIHYATPDGRLIPFCSYNSGPEFRNEVEQKFSIPLKEWKRKND